MALVETRIPRPRLDEQTGVSGELERREVCCTYNGPRPIHAKVLVAWSEVRFTLPVNRHPAYSLKRQAPSTVHHSGCVRRESTLYNLCDGIQ